MTMINPKRGRVGRTGRVVGSITLVVVAIVATSLAMTLTGCRARAAQKEMRSDEGRKRIDRRIVSASIAKPTAKATPSLHDYRLPRTDNELATTSAIIFFANFDGMIAGTTRRVEQEPTSAAARRDLSNLLYSRAKHRGDLAELGRALAIMAEAILLDPTDGTAYLSRANQLQTMHRFQEARQDLSRARAAFLKAAGTGSHTPSRAETSSHNDDGDDGGPTDTGVADVHTLEAEIDYAQGRYESAIPVIREAAAARRRTSSSVARLALLEHDLGNYDLADRLFSEAEGLIRDPNPIPVAWLNLQRGIHCQTTGQLERAVTFFREAARRIPHYVSAEEHLAETLHMLGGQDDEAIRLYEAIVSRSSDPEFRGALAGLYRERGRVAEADQLVGQATAEYSTLLTKYPEAMFWHASEYFLAEGKDAPRALELLKKNALLRPSASSFVALARASLKNKDLRGAKTAIDKALRMPVQSAEGWWTAAEIEAATSAPSQADSHTKIEVLRSKARAINPRIGMGTEQ